MSPFWIRTHAMDPLSITASTITIIGAARAAFQFLQTVIQEVGNDGDINALNADVKALFDELELVDNNCESLSQFQVDPTLRKRIETERRACGVTLDKFKSTVEQVTGRIDDPGVVRRFKVMVVRLLKSPSVERLHRQMAQHQQRLHFYVTLMTDRKIDEILKAVQTPRNPPSNRHDSSQTLPAEPQPRRRSTNDLPPRPLSIASDTRPPLRRFNTVPSPFPKDSVDHLRPPGLVYKDRLLSQTLLKGCCLANAISKSGQFVTFIRKDVFSVFDIAGCAPLLICTGKRSKGDYRYGHLEPTMHQHDSRMVPGVSSACISDDYLVIAVEGVCFVFTIWGGRWLSMPSIDTGAIEKVVFSPAGDLLLAITKVRINNESKRRAVLYLTADFTPDLRNPEIAKTVSGRKIAEWPSSCEIVDVVFSDDGRSIAISTGHDSSGYSTIWLLKAGPTNVWARKEGTVQVLDKMDATSPGIKGMSFFGKNGELVFAMKTSHSNANDWYCITHRRTILQHKTHTIASKDSLSNNVAVAVSSRHNAVVLASITASRESLLEFKQQCYEPLHLSLNLTHTSFKCKLQMPLSLSFSRDGTRLILLTGNGVLEIHKFEVKE